VEKLQNKLDAGSTVNHDINDRWSLVSLTTLFLVEGLADCGVDEIE
jgi:hypothetical protein